MAPATSAHAETGDEEPADPRPTPGSLHIDDERAAPIPIEDFSAGIVASAAETMAMLAEHRFTRPLALRPTREERILTLADAIFATGERAIGDLLGWWEQCRETTGAWALWPAVFVPSLIDGPAGLVAVEWLMDTLRPDEREAVLVAANALAAVPHPALGVLAEDLVESENPIAVAVGLETLSRRGLADAERFERHLSHGAPAEVAAALRALVRCAPPAPPVGRVLALLEHADPEVAWEAARAVTLWGEPHALTAIRDGRALAATLGGRAVELFVMAGEREDLACIEAVIGRAPMTPDLLDAIARFGSPLVWSFLLHHLADVDLADAAEEALRTLFGPIVAPDAARTASAWREALAERDIDPALRYRHGEPWKPALVAHACADIEGSDALSQRTVERWLDELGARVGAPVVADLSIWTPGAASALAPAIKAARAASWAPGAWGDVRGRALDGRNQR